MGDRSVRGTAGFELRVEAGRHARAFSLSPSGERVPSVAKAGEGPVKARFPRSPLPGPLP
ncbi:MAG TPA: hypothetical protein VN110_05945, partial [Sphingobium sp.]|nr:hypothetical protein [Sphingobium sp.]